MHALHGDLRRVPINWNSLALGKMDCICTGSSAVPLSCRQVTLLSSVLVNLQILFSYVFSFTFWSAFIICFTAVVVDVADVMNNNKKQNYKNKVKAHCHRILDTVRPDNIRFVVILCSWAAIKVDIFSASLLQASICMRVGVLVRGTMATNIPTSMVRKPVS
ncbi:hypothetical protein FF38_11610 [Lucilia cuprina]|uniref:Uncharacterized protein n=1 Tax=Lucilia cuprina TaxID=7375 RepID=A0A0L0BXL4_LUCCU|nr:hypothetical protein FF38_11610 [Lucilia cuprina]